MRKLYTIIGLAGALIAPNVQAGFGGDVYLTGGGNNGGGPFSAFTSGNGDFPTFCLSINTYFQTSVHYSYEVSQTIDANEPIPGYDYVTLQTAYIYHEYLAGNPNFANGNAVQSTIWYSQGLLNGYVDTEGPVNLQADITSILAYVPAAYQSSAPADLAFGVEVMNMMPGYEGAQYAQPQLIAVPEPATMISGVLLLLPFGASTLRILRRNRAA